MARSPNTSDRNITREHGDQSTWSLLWRLIDLGRAHKVQIALALLVNLAMQIMLVGGFFSAGLAIDVLRHHADPAAPAPNWPLGVAPAPDTPFLTILGLAAGATLVFGLLSSVGYFLSRWTDELLAQSIVVDLRDRLYRKIQSLPFTFYDTHDSGTIINRMTADVNSMRTFMQGVMIRAATSTLTTAVFLTALLGIHVGLTVACLSVTVVQAGIMWSWGRKARPAFRRLRKLIDELILRLSEGVQGIRVVRAFGRESEQIERFQNQSVDARDERISIWRMMANHMPFVQGSSWIAVAILIGYGGHLVNLGPAAGGIALGSIWVYFGLLRTLAAQIEAISQIAAQIPEAMSGAERIFGILDMPNSIASPVGSSIGGDSAIRGEIEFRNVSFIYPGGSDNSVESDDLSADQHGPEILRGVNLLVRAGETVAVVGPTGAGKTTLLNLIPRFYDPVRGQVLVDGVDLRSWQLPTLRRAIGFVFQEPYLFSNTIHANIAFGVPDLAWEGTARYAEIASANEFIRRLPRQYETIIGERGMTLSGGERQRLTLARALAIDPPILILDDAMSAVDASTERQIETAIQSELRRRTTLIVAHRLSTLRRADRVIVLEAGRIVAEGRHDELMRGDSHYRDAALAQLEDDLADEEH